MEDNFLANNTAIFCRTKFYYPSCIFLDILQIKRPLIRLNIS